jgi:hypothetical protein
VIKLPWCSIAGLSINGMRAHAMGTTAFNVFAKPLAFQGFLPTSS